MRCIQACIKTMNKIAQLPLHPFTQRVCVPCGRSVRSRHCNGVCIKYKLCGIAASQEVPFLSSLVSCTVARRALFVRVEKTAFDVQALPKRQVGVLSGDQYGAVERSLSEFRKRHLTCSPCQKEAGRHFGRGPIMDTRF